MAKNVLSPSESESYISTLLKCNIEDLGTLAWYEQHQRLQKLNIQAIVEVNGLVEENVKEYFIAEDKIYFLVEEAITIAVWKEKIFEYMFEIVPKPENTFMAYIVLLHEGTCISLLENLLYHADACEALRDSCIDLADYAVGYATRLLVPKVDHEDDVTLDESELVTELRKQRQTIEHDIGLRSITIISYMAQNLDALPAALAHRLLVYHDTPILFTSLMDNAPWGRDYNGPLKRNEAQCWLALRQLLINPERTRQYYELTDYRKQILLKLLGHLSEVVIDQIPPLGDLKLMLTHIQMSAAPTNISTRPILLEILPEIREKLLQRNNRQWRNLAKIFVQRLFNASEKDMQILAKGFSDTYDMDILDSITNRDRKCAGGCGEKAESRCSRCREVWYCSRACQIKAWPEHKTICEKIHFARTKLEG